MDDRQPERAECDTCDWTLTRNEVIRYIWNHDNMRPTPRLIRRTFSSLREGHAYFQRGHAPYCIYEEEADA